MIFITGGARSGKSSFAEKLAIDYAVTTNSRNLYYLACGLASDNEMKERIVYHQQDREASTIPWQTIECPYDLGKVDIPNDSVVLLDCVTTLLSNEMYANDRESDENLVDDIIKDIQSIHAQSKLLVVVSNELQSGVPIENEFVFHYQYKLGRLHQALVKYSSEAVLMEAGLPIHQK
jgi:adenosylcobinamide kinase / adenosylcobinamide-phosphate guanylyltransferase